MVYNWILRTVCQCHELTLNKHFCILYLCILTTVQWRIQMHWDTRITFNTWPDCYLSYPASLSMNNLHTDYVPTVIKGPMNTVWMKTIVFNLINNVRMCFCSILINYWKNTNKVTSPSSLKNGHLQRGSNIFVTGHMTGSGDTTCK